MVTQGARSFECELASPGAGRLRRGLVSFVGVNRLTLLLCVPLLLTCGGCGIFGSGSLRKANVELRKEIQALESQVEDVKRQLAAERALVQGLQSARPTVASLPSERLANLFTTRGLKFGRLTGGADLDREKPGHEGIKVYVAPTDESGQAIKAAGSFKVEAFDLANPRAPLVGSWDVPLEQARKSWSGYLLDYNYVLTLPWQGKLPEHPDLTLKVTFFDELLQLPFTAQKEIRVDLPPKGPDATATVAATRSS